MTKNTKSILTVLAVIGIVAAGYHFFHRTAKKYAAIIIEFGGSNTSQIELVNLNEEDFLKSWAKALMKQNKDFTYKGDVFSAIGGTKIVKPTT